MKTSLACSVPKAADRFKKFNCELPPPNNYSANNGFNQTFNSKYGQKVIFGSDKRTFVDDSWRLDQGKTTPGPGTYLSFSDFNGPN